MTDPTTPRPCVSCAELRGLLLDVRGWLCDLHNQAYVKAQRRLDAALALPCPHTQAAAREANGCPCCYGSPCSEQCTCARPMMSGGCGRCARYGSEEQQRDAARVLIEREQQAVAREAELVAALRAAHPMVLAAASPDFVAEYERILASPSVAGEAYRARLEAAEAALRQINHDAEMAGLDESAAGRGRALRAVSKTAFDALRASEAGR